MGEKVRPERGVLTMSVFLEVLFLWGAFLSIFPSSCMIVEAEIIRDETRKSSLTPIPKITIGHDVHGNSVDMPLVGAGTWQYNNTVAYESLCKAFDEGYTMVDTAWGYKNQRGVGRAIRDCWNRTREELFVLTKIPGGLHLEEALQAHRDNLVQLGLAYVDHLMVHYPADWSTTPSRSSKSVRQNEWIALENVYFTDEARSIGISHYCSPHIDDVLEVATITPSLNQVEYHVGSGDVNAVIQKCQSSNITFMSFSPLCGPCELKNMSDSLVNGGLVTTIGQQHNVTGSQVSLRFIVQQALSTPFIGGVIPKSNNSTHIRMNRDLFSFELTEVDMQKLMDATQPAAEPGDCDVP